MDRLSSMTAFVKTIELGSFAAAATTLGRSPQMIAKQVAWLEARLGTRLIDRTTRRQSVTELGRTFYDRCKVVLADVDWADSVADEMRGKPRGRLRINAPVSFGTESLMPVIACYLRENEDVEIDLVLSDRFVDLVEDSFDAVFRAGPRTDDGLAAVELSPLRLLACASPGYLARRGEPASPMELVDHECIGHAHWSQPSNFPWRFAIGGKVEEVAVEGRLRVNDAQALLAAAQTSFGIVFIPHDLARDAIDAGQLVRVLPDFETTSRPMHLLFRADRRQTPKLRTFVNTVFAAFPPD